MKRYIAALDQGTTSSRCILFDQDQNILGTAQRELTQIYPQPGWVEQDPMEIWSTQYSVLTEVLAQTGISPHELAAIGITNQRETTIVWDKVTGRPIYNAIVWQCRRTSDYRTGTDGALQPAVRHHQLETDEGAPASVRPHDTVQPAKTGRRQASAGFLKAIFCKAAHQGVTAQVCPSAS